MRHRAAVVLLVAWLTATTGCLDLFGRTFKDHEVARTPLDANGWNRDGLFSVEVRDAEPVTVRIEAISSAQGTLHSEGVSGAGLPAVELRIPDGLWTVRYFLDGTRWETFKDIRFDGTPPTLTSLESSGAADAQGAYLLGAAAVVEAGATVRVVEQATGRTVATSLPYAATGLGDGLHVYDVVVSDAAGNQVTQAVQVRAGSAQLLPAGQHTLGLVARYTLDAQMWDLTGLDGWLAPDAARAQAQGQWLGSGTGIRPDDPAVTSVVAQRVTASMTSGAAALALFQWMADALDYDTARLDDDDLLDPAATIENGGGVCRDLAALYVSLLRASGIPARLVTGYLGGEVNGFHAWVEFYGGPGHGPSPWVPVDVSAVTGAYSPDMALQAFGIRHTNMLPLRVVSENQEDGAWSTAVSIQARYPQGSEPRVDLAKTLRAEGTPQTGVLCVDRATLARLDARRAEDCPARFPLYLRDFERSASLVLDYGATIAATPGTTVTLTLSSPDAAATAPDTVEQQTYGAAFSTLADGTKQGTWAA